MGGVGEDAEDNYRLALEDLGKRAEEAVDVIAAEYDALPEDQYLDRWSLVQLLSELRQPKAAGARPRRREHDDAKKASGRGSWHTAPAGRR